MARQLPDPNLIYSAREVYEMFDLGSERNLMDHVNRGDFPSPVQQSREAEPQWEGDLLRAWIRVRPTLKRPPAEKNSENSADEPPRTGNEPARTRTNRRRTETYPNEPAQDAQ